MRTLSEIVDICKSGGKPTIDEARLAVCVLNALLTFETMRLMRRAENVVRNDVTWRDYEEHFNRCRNAFSQSPVDYLGNEYNPDDSEVRKRRNILVKLMDKFLSQEKQ